MHKFKVYIDTSIDKSTYKNIKDEVSLIESWSMAETEKNADSIITSLSCFRNSKWGIRPVILTDLYDSAVSQLNVSSKEKKIKDRLDEVVPIIQQLHELISLAKPINKDAYFDTLAYIWARPSGLSPLFSQKFSKGYVFPETSTRPCDIITVLEFLESSGYIHSRPLETYHSCPSCGGIIVLFRDGCVNCASSLLEKKDFIHHFKCGFQGPEDEFRIFNVNNISELICPKCENQLVHYGVDYDRPGILQHCMACNFESSATEVYGHCLSCKHDCKGVDSPELLFRSYHVTPLGERVLLDETNEAFSGKAITSTYVDLMPFNLFLITMKKFLTLRESIETELYKIDFKEQKKTEGLGEQTEALVKFGKELAHKLRPSDSITYHHGALYAFLVEAKNSKNPRDLLISSKGMKTVFSEETLKKILIKKINAETFLKSIRK